MINSFKEGFNSILNSNTKIVNAIKTLKTLSDKYEESSTLTFNSNVHYICTNLITNFGSVSISANLKNTSCIFSTGSSVSGTINVANGMKINKPFEFEPNKSYIISVDNNTILWNEIIDTESSYSINGTVTPDSQYINWDDLVGQAPNVSTFTNDAEYATSSWVENNFLQNLKAISLIKPVSIDPLYLHIEYSENLNFSAPSTLIDLRTANSSIINVKAFNGNEYESITNENGLNASYNGYPILINIPEMPLNKPIYIKYYWYSYDTEEHPSDWYSLIYPIFSELFPSLENNNLIKYEDTLDVEFKSNTHFTCINDITNIDCSISNELNNTSCTFTTGSSISYNFSIGSGMKINEAISLEPNKSYIISINNNVILWHEIVEADASYSNINVKPPIYVGTD